jgi:hypothetical protein
MKVRAFIERTAKARDLATFHATLLPAIMELVPCYAACHAEIDMRTGQVVSQQAVGADGGPVFLDVDAFNLHKFDHPIFAEWAKGNTATARRIDYLDTRSWHKRSLYREVYKPMGCEDSLAIPVPATDGLMACFCIERATPLPSARSC